MLQLLKKKRYCWPFIQHTAIEGSTLSIYNKLFVWCWNVAIIHDFHIQGSIGYNVISINDKKKVDICHNYRLIALTISQLWHEKTSLHGTSLRTRKKASKFPLYTLFLLLLLFCCFFTFGLNLSPKHEAHFWWQCFK